MNWLIQMSFPRFSKAICPSNNTLKLSRRALIRQFMSNACKDKNRTARNKESKNILPIFRTVEFISKFYLFRLGKTQTRITNFERVVFRCNFDVVANRVRAVNQAIFNHDVRRFIARGQIFGSTTTTPFCVGNQSRPSRFDLKPAGDTPPLHSASSIPSRTP